MTQHTSSHRALARQFRLRAPLAAHAWTIGPNLLARFTSKPAPAALAWSYELSDPDVGGVRLTGLLQPGVADACLVIVHGLGGSYDRPYCVNAAWAAQRAGLPCLRFGLRGADRSGEDFYHGGLTADLAAAVASPQLAQFKRLYILGYSLGGHVTLRYAIGEHDPRVAAVAAICAPLDLDLGAQSIDSKRSAIYRRHVLSGLNEIYSAVAQKRSVPTPLSRVLAARSIREWDGLTVVPRYGFRDAEDYYASISVGPRLSQLRIPALLVQSKHDPMVPLWTYQQHLAQAPKLLEVRTLGQGGHVGFPRVALHPQAQPGVLEDQLLAWLQQH
ncbi:MAG TPA: alpha/beta fold hydrolase [Polyangiales bacterium]|nr:alpha/beta fold hydrolase [Polyangiales bacterium]